MTVPNYYYFVSVTINLINILVHLHKQTIAERETYIIIIHYHIITVIVSTLLIQSNINQHKQNRKSNDEAVSEEHYFITTILSR